MKRKIYREILNWKNDPARKPLILKGARQVGKTWLLKKLGHQEYDHSVYLNFEENPSLKNFFNGQKDPKKIIRNLSAYYNTKISPQKTLIIFDEIQECNDALNALKYFYENAPQYHIVSAGSLIGVKLSTPQSFPVGKVNFIDVYPLNFPEFLEANNESTLLELLNEKKSFTPFPLPLHEKLIEYLRNYYYCGGMPEAVLEFLNSGDFHRIRKIHKEILNGYTLDFAKHAPSSDIPKLSVIWEMIPSQLGKANKRFVFSAIKKSARAREYEGALRWLEDAGMILKVYQVKTGKYPLKFYAENSIFKVYALDVGLLGALANFSPKVFVEGDAVFSQFEGMFVENYVAQQLTARGFPSLYYWVSEGIAEVDFLYEQDGRVFPLEAKSGINLRSKSLNSYDKKYQPEILCRTSLLNRKKDGKKINIPLYAIHTLDETIKK